MNLLSSELPVDHRNQHHGQNRIQRQAHIQNTEYFAENGDQIEGAQMLIELQQTDRHHSNHDIQPVRHSLKERGNEHDDKGCGYCNHRGFCFCGNEHGQCSQEKVADITADQGQYPGLPKGDVIQRFPDPQLNHAIATFEAKVAQCDEAVDQHGCPIQDCNQQKSRLDLCGGGFVSSEQRGEINRIRFPFELVGEDTGYHISNDQNS